MKLTASPLATTVLRLIYDAHRRQSKSDLDLLDGILGTTDRDDLRFAVEDLAVVALSLVDMLEQLVDLDFDRWLAEQAIATAAKTGGAEG